MSIKKFSKKVGVFLIAMMLFAAVMPFSENAVYAYDEKVSSGVVPIIFYVNDGKKIIFDTEAEEIVDVLSSYTGELSGGTGFFVGADN